MRGHYSKPSYYKRYSKKILSKDFPDEIDIRGEVFIQNVILIH